MRCLRFMKVPAMAAVALVVAGQARTAWSSDFSGFPGVGSWYGKAVELCASGSAPSACFGGFPAVTMFVTSTLTSDGLFIGDDSLQFGGPPFAPHTTAHGQWFPSSSNQFIADYVFMSSPFPPVPNSVAGYRARWVAQVADPGTIFGWINLYTTPPVPLQWQAVAGNSFPIFPPEAANVVAPASPFFFDPNLCFLAGIGNCPIVFKFTLKRVGS